MQPLAHLLLDRPNTGNPEPIILVSWIRQALWVNTCPFLVRSIEATHLTSRIALPADDIMMKSCYGQAGSFAWRSGTVHRLQSLLVVETLDQLSVDLFSNLKTDSLAPLITAPGGMSD
jgi:hypothetical protein